MTYLVPDTPFDANWRELRERMSRGCSNSAIAASAAATQMLHAAPARPRSAAASVMHYSHSAQMQHGAQAQRGASSYAGAFTRRCLVFLPCPLPRLFLSLF